MGHFKVTDHLASHPSATRTDLAAIGFWVIAGAWCAQHSPDGFVPAHMLQCLRGTPELADALVKTGLWKRRRGGYAFMQEVPASPKAPPLPMCGWSLDEHRRKIPREVKRRVYERDEFRCVLCGETEDLTLDHILPWSLGGLDTVQNLRVLCRPCNSKKGARV